MQNRYLQYQILDNLRMFTRTQEKFWEQGENFKMTKKSEADLRTMIRNKVIFLLGVEGVVNEVVEACRKHQFPVYYWCDVVTSSEVRGECTNQKPIPPFHIYDDNGNDLRGPFWYMEDVYKEAGVIFDESPHYEFLEIQNFASNSCHRIELGDVFEGNEELTQEQINELFGSKGEGDDN